jgi:hypothetical protein
MKSPGHASICLIPSIRCGTCSIGLHEYKKEVSMGASEHGN